MRAGFKHIMLDSILGLFNKADYVILISDDLCFLRSSYVNEWLFQIN